MKHRRFALLLAGITVLCAPAVLVAKRSLSDYPLRLHIYQTHWNHNSFGYHAFGRANLFDERGVPHGVEYTYDCADHLMASSGNEGYPAKWKKTGQSAEVIFGEIGQKPDQFRVRVQAGHEILCLLLAQRGREYGECVRIYGKALESGSDDRRGDRG